MRRVFGDALISGAALVVLLIGLMALDETVRDRVLTVIENGEVSSSVSSVVSTGRSVASVLLVAAHDQSLDHAPLAVFVVAGTALMLAMLRL